MRELAAADPALAWEPSYALPGDFLICQDVSSYARVCSTGARESSSASFR